MMLQIPRRLWLALALFPGSAFALGLGEVRHVSALNQPLSAEIPILSAAPDELASLRASIASREEFARLGLDRPGFASALSVKVGKGANGEPVLWLRSSEGISEPFVTLVVDAGWNRGRLLREYTLLLDPPVYRDTVAKAVAAPVALPVASTEPTVRAAAPAAVASAPASTGSATGSSSELSLGSSYRVRTNDSALRIARLLGARERSQIDQTVVALFQQNPGAFAGNINRLRAGATVRLPSADEIAAISPADARREVVAQLNVARAEAAARAAAAAGTSAEETAAAAPAAPAKPVVAAPARLRLVPPGAASSRATAPAATGSDPAVVGRLQQLETELQEARRLLQMQSDQLARMQQQGQAGATPAVPTVAPPVDAAIAPSEGTDAAVDEATQPAATPAAPGPAVAASPAPAPAEQESSFLDAVGGLSTLLLGGAFLLLAGGLGYGYVRRRRDADGADFDVAEATTVRDDFFQQTGTLPAPVRPPAAHMEVLENPVTQHAPPVVRPRPPTRNAEDTLSGESAIDLDKADAITEANWHVAYGLYDQAADTLRLALRNEPGRRDLKVKLLEVYFVWGKSELFLELARNLGQTRAQGGPGEWDSIAIMGRQIAPQDPLFAGAATKTPVTSVDLNLEGGQNRVDVELFDTPLPSAVDSADLDALDFDLEGALDFSEGPLEATQKQWRGDSPTIEQPALSLPDATLRQKVDMAIIAAAPTSAAATGGLDATAEMSMDDLNLDLHLDLDAADQGDEGLGLPDLSPLEVTAHPGDITSTHTMKRPLDPSPTINNTLTEEIAFGELPIEGIEPVTLSEVGTKLDLARAYMDMGDPEGARNILAEVVAEGSPGQQQEAKRLLGSLPG